MTIFSKGMIHNPNPTKDMRIMIDPDGVSHPQWSTLDEIKGAAGVAKLEVDLQSEVTARTNGIAQIERDLQYEATARDGADQNLQQQVTTLGQSISTEVDKRSTGDEGLQYQINTLTGSTAGAIASINKTIDDLEADVESQQQQIDAKSQRIDKNDTQIANKVDKSTREGENNGEMYNCPTGVGMFTSNMSISNCVNASHESAKIEALDLKTLKYRAVAVNSDRAYVETSTNEGLKKFEIIDESRLIGELGQDKTRVINQKTVSENFYANSIYNVSAVNKTAYTRKSDARLAVPEKYRKPGLLLTYSLLIENIPTPLLVVESCTIAPESTEITSDIWTDSQNWMNVQNSIGDLQTIPDGSSVQFSAVIVDKAGMSVYSLNKGETGLIFKPDNWMLVTALPNITTPQIYPAGMTLIAIERSSGKIVTCYPDGTFKRESENALSPIQSDINQLDSAEADYIKNKECIGWGAPVKEIIKEVPTLVSFESDSYTPDATKIKYTDINSGEIIHVSEIIKLYGETQSSIHFTLPFGSYRATYDFMATGRSSHEYGRIFGRLYVKYGTIEQEMVGLLEIGNAPTNFTLDRDVAENEQITVKLVTYPDGYEVLDFKLSQGVVEVLHLPPYPTNSHINDRYIYDNKIIQWDGNKWINIPAIVGMTIRNTSEEGFPLYHFDGTTWNKDLQYKAVNQKVIYVDGEYAGDIESGSINAPFKTIQNAINSAKFGSIIEIASGEYNEDILIFNLNNITLNSTGTTGQYKTIVSGGLTIDGNSDNICINNIQFEGALDKMANGTCHIDNCKFTYVIVSGSGYMRLGFCFISKGLCHQVVSHLALFNCEFDKEAVCAINGGGFEKKTCFHDCLLVTIASHEGGVLMSEGSTSFVGTTTCDAITSTAGVADGALLLLGGTTLNDFQCDRINKTGDCAWATGVFIHNPHEDILNGYEMEVGLFDTDIRSSIGPSNYQTLDYSLYGHLNGIDAAFGNRVVSGEQIGTVPRTSTIVSLTQAEYNTISIKDANTLYIIV